MLWIWLTGRPKPESGATISSFSPPSPLLPPPFPLLPLTQTKFTTTPYPELLSHTSEDIHDNIIENIFRACLVQVADSKRPHWDARDVSKVVFVYEWRRVDGCIRESWAGLWAMVSESKRSWWHIFWGCRCRSLTFGLATTTRANIPFAFAQINV